MGASVSQNVKTILAALNREGLGLVTRAEFAEWTRSDIAELLLTDETRRLLSGWEEKGGDSLLNVEELTKFISGIDDMERKSIFERLNDRLPLASFSETEVDFSDEELTVAEAKILVSLLHDNKTVTHFDISSNSLPESIIVSIAVLLEKNNTLKELALSANAFGERGIIALAKALKTNKSLSELKLGSTDCNDTAVKALAEALTVHPALTSLDLHSTWIGPEGSCALAEALKRSGLKELNMQFCGIGDKGAAAFATAFKESKTLTFANLSGFVVFEQKDPRQKVSDEGAIALAAGIQANSSLKELMLEHHEIGDKGCVALAAAISENKTLNFVSLEYNSMLEEGTAALKKARSSRKDLRIEFSTEIVPPPLPEEIPPPPPSESELPPPPPPMEFRQDNREYHARRVSMALDGDPVDNFVLRDNPLAKDGKEEGKSEAKEGKAS